MTILKILQYPDPRLKQVAKPVEKIDARIQKIIDDMLETLANTKNCAALAATQLDIAAPPFITVIDRATTQDKTICLINPKIIKAEGEQFEYEGCMSVRPDLVHERVKRAFKVTVEALDPAGNPITFEAEGYLAKCIQHEIDHLQGKLYIDHLSRLKLERIRSKIKKYV